MTIHAALLTRRSIFLTERPESENFKVKLFEIRNIMNLHNKTIIVKGRINLFSPKLICANKQHNFNFFGNDVKTFGSGGGCISLKR